MRFCSDEKSQSLIFFVFLTSLLKMVDVDVKRVAVIGAGPAGAITIDALAQEGKFDIIRVFERREGPGGCWYVCRCLV